MERYKVLAAMLRLNEFTAADLASFSGVKRNTVHTVLRREAALLEEVGRDETGQRGGQFLRYRVKSERAEQLRSEIEKLRNVSRPHSESAPKIPSGFLVAQRALLNALPQASSLEEKEYLLQVAKYNLQGARLELKTSVGFTSYEAADDSIKRHATFTETLTKLSEARLSAEQRGTEDQVMSLNSACRSLVELFNSQGEMSAVIMGAAAAAEPRDRMLVAATATYAGAEASAEDDHREGGDAYYPLGIYQDPSLASRQGINLPARFAAAETHSIIPGDSKRRSHIYIYDAIVDKEGVHPDQFTERVARVCRRSDVIGDSVVKTVELIPGIRVAIQAIGPNEFYLLTVNSERAHQEATAAAVEHVLGSSNYAPHVVVLDEAYDAGLRNCVLTKRAGYIPDGRSLTDEALVADLCHWISTY